MKNRSCFGLPRGVEFQRWNGDGEWVFYHPGTGETMRLSEIAVIVLEILGETGPSTVDGLTCAIAEYMEEPPEKQILSVAADEVLSVLLKHEWIERLSCPG